MRNFIVVGKNRGLVLQVLIAIHTFTDANCVVMSPGESRFLRFSRLCSIYREVSLYGEDDEKFVHEVNSLVETLPGLQLICADCEGARMIWRVRNQLKATIAPVPDPLMIDCFDNKWHFYQFCHEHGINAPLTRFIGSKQELEFATTALELGLPFVVKPVNEAGAKGVHVIFNEDDYRRRILDNDAYQLAPLIAQAYVRGTEVGLDLLAVNGKVAAIAIQQRHYPQHDGAKISFIHNAYLESVAHSICLKSGYEGVMNIDARIEEGTNAVFLIESNPRYWRSLLASVWCGLNFVEESVDLPSLNDMRILTSGDADTFYHPLFRPSLWRHALFDRSGHRGRIVRCTMFDVCMFGASVKATLTASARRRPPAAIAALQLIQQDSRVRS